MSSCCEGLREQFGDRQAARDLRRFRRRGPPRPTRLLVEALSAEGIKGATLLDIGGGVGAIQHLLLEREAASTTDVDVSPAYLEAARTEGNRRGLADRMDFRLGDFVDVASSIDGADIVTLDRVICCYPDMVRLVGESASRARRLYGLVYPRSGAAVKFAGSAGNLFLRLRGRAFRIHIHDTERVDREVRGLGFELRYRRAMAFWQVFVYRRAAPRVG